MDNFDLRKFLAEGKLYEANSPELDKAKEDYMAGKISLADYQAIVKKLDFKGVKDAEAKAQAKADAIAAEKKELEDKKAKVKQAEKDRKAGKISQEEFAKIVQANQYVNKESLNEAMSPQDVVDIADTVAEEFTKESADAGEFLVYSVGKMEADDMSFELDTDVTSQTPKSIDTRGVGEGWGGIFRIKPTEDGYEVRNAEKGGLVAMIDNAGNFKMLSADESRAELLGEPDVDYKNDEPDFNRYMEEGEEVSEAEEVKEYSSKMKKSELKEMIRAAFLNEAEGEEEEDVEAEIEADVDVDVDADMDMDMDMGSETDGIDVKQDADTDLGGTVGDVQDNLEAALEAARELGDEKLEDQIGNTLTFFTRTHVVK